MWWHTVTQGWGSERGNCRMQCVASTLHTTSEHGVSSITTADAHTSAASSPLNWRPPADLNGLGPFRAKDEIWFLRVCHHISTGLYHVVSEQCNICLWTPLMDASVYINFRLLVTWWIQRRLLQTYNTGGDCVYTISLGAFRIISGKAAIRLVMSVRPSARPNETTRLPLCGFSWNLTFAYFFETLSIKFQSHYNLT